MFSVRGLALLLLFPFPDIVQMAPCGTVAAHDDGDKKALFKVKLDTLKKGDAHELPLIITVRNISDFRIGFYQVAGIPLCKLILKDQNGKAAEFANDGKYLFDGEAHFLNSTEIVAVKTGKEESWTIDFSKYFKLTKGTWRIEFAMTAPIVCKPNGEEVANIRDLYEFTAKAENFSYVVDH